MITVWGERTEENENSAGSGQGNSSNNVRVADAGTVTGTLLGLGIAGILTYYYGEEVAPKIQDYLAQKDNSYLQEKKPPPGSKPIDKTPWSRDHQDIKEGIGHGPTDNTVIDPDDNVWGENSDGTWSNHGPAGDYTGSGKPSGTNNSRGRGSRGRGR